LIEHLAKLNTTFGIRPSNGSTIKSYIITKQAIEVHQATLKWHMETPIADHLSWIVSFTSTSM